MSVQRSPISGRSISGSGSGSTPDLRILEDTPKITHRKRKQPDSDCDHATQLADFRTEIMSFFKEFAKSQQENCLQLQREITEIKNEIKSTKQISESLVTEQNSLKQEICLLKSINNTYQQKITQLEVDVSKLKQCDSSAQPQNPLTLGHQDTILELQDRYRREKNIVIVGISELNDSNKEIRFDHDKNKVMDVIKSIYPECPNPCYIIRLGKYIPNKNRALKVCFESPDTTKYILRNKSKHSLSQVNIYSDQTPLQQQYLKQLSSELQRRQQNGEADLIIKYIGGIPKIIKPSPKNDK